MAVYDTNKRNCVVNAQCTVDTSLTICAISTFCSLYPSALADCDCRVFRQGKKVLSKESICHFSS